MHRDVKPANVLLTTRDHAYLTDFGLTKRLAPDHDVTGSGRLLGTLNFVAPEQIRGEQIGPATDVYALGGTLFRLLTGRVPFPLDTEEGKLWAHLSEPPPSASDLCAEVPKALDDVIRRAMSKRPEDRFASAGELCDAAEAALEAQARPSPGSASERMPGPRPPPAQAGRRSSCARWSTPSPWSCWWRCSRRASDQLRGRPPRRARPLCRVRRARLPGRGHPRGRCAAARGGCLRARRPRRCRRPSSPPRQAASLDAPRSRIDAMLDEALEKEAEIRNTIEEVREPGSEVARELDQLTAPSAGRRPTPRSSRTSCTTPPRPRSSGGSHSSRASATRATRASSRPFAGSSAPAGPWRSRSASSTRR